MGSRRSAGGPSPRPPDLLHFITARAELAHVRTRHHAPETNGVVERFNQTLRYEHLDQFEIADALELADEVEALRELFPGA
jgi:transposase InsO family protein